MDAVRELFDEYSSELEEHKTTLNTFIDRALPFVTSDTEAKDYNPILNTNVNVARATSIAIDGMLNYMSMNKSSDETTLEIVTGISESMDKLKLLVNQVVPGDSYNDEPDIDGVD